MLVILKSDATQDDVQALMRAAGEMGYASHPLPGKQRPTIGLVGEGGARPGRLESLRGVLEVVQLPNPYEQASREWREEPTVVELPTGVRIGPGRVTVVAEVGSLRSERQIVRLAHRLCEAGASILRGNVFGCGTSPYSSPGAGEAGLRLLARARAETGLDIMAEAVDARTLERVAEHADVVQIGACNMQNYSLLRRAGRAGKPVLLERGMAATIQDFLSSAEYLLAEGNGQVILCERGVRGFDAQSCVLDLTIVPVVKSLSHLPIFAATGCGATPPTQVAAMARAAVAAGADGLVIEIPAATPQARREGTPVLLPRDVSGLMRQVAKVACAVGRAV